MNERKKCGRNNGVHTQFLYVFFFLVLLLFILIPSEDWLARAEKFRFLSNRAIFIGKIAVLSLRFKSQFLNKNPMKSLQKYI